MRLVIRSASYNTAAERLTRVRSASVLLLRSTIVETKLVPARPTDLRLPRTELRAKACLQAALGSGLRPTDVDILLNTGKIERANDILQHITEILAESNAILDQ